MVVMLENSRIIKHLLFDSAIDKSEIKYFLMFILITKYNVKRRSRSAEPPGDADVLKTRPL